MKVYARTKDPQPKSRLLVIIEPREKFSLKRGVNIRVPRGVLGWEPGNPLKCKVTNVASTSISIPKGVPVTMVYNVNNVDEPQIQFLFEPLPQSCTRDQRSKMNVSKGEVDPTTKSPQQDNLDEATIAQLSPSEKDLLVKVLKNYTEVFAANLKAAVSCRGAPIKLEHNDLNINKCEHHGYNARSKDLYRGNVTVSVVVCLKTFFPERLSLVVFPEGQS